MYRNGTRSHAQRWRCAQCGALDSGRGQAAKGLRTGRRYSLGAVMSPVVQGVPVEDIAAQLGIGSQAVAHRLANIEAAARARFDQKPPGVGAGWDIVSLSPREGAAAVVAVGQARGGFPRLLDWERGTGQQSVQALAKRLGKPPRARPRRGSQKWLDQALVPGMASEAETEQRLWVILARSNGWNLD